MTLQINAEDFGPRKGANSKSSIFVSFFASVYEVLHMPLDF